MNYKIKIAKIVFPIIEKYEDTLQIEAVITQLYEEKKISYDDFKYIVKHFDEILLDWESKI